MKGRGNSGSEVLNADRITFNGEIADEMRLQDHGDAVDMGRQKEDPFLA
jgi:hypothetical protein